MLRNLDTQVTEFFDCDVKLTDAYLDARLLREFADAQMPRTGVGEVPWSTPLSSGQLSELAAAGKAEFVLAHMMLAADAPPPLIGIGALIRSPENYAKPRLIIVVENESRAQGIGARIANELLRRLGPGEIVQAEIQRASGTRSRAAKFFEALGFECVEEKHRVGDVPKYKSGVLKGTVQTSFALYEFTKAV